MSCTDPWAIFSFLAFAGLRSGDVCRRHRTQGVEVRDHGREILSRLLIFRKKLLQNFRPRELAGSIGGAVTRLPFAGRFEPPGAGIKL